MNLQTKVYRINTKIAALEAELRGIRELVCKHPDETLLRKSGANTGNYDPSSDCYWYDFHCQICGKKWTTEQTWEHGQRGTEVKEKY